MSLARIQEAFLDEVLGESGPRNPGMAVYRRNALAVRRDALAAAHPVVCRLVGDAFFDEAAARFARASPSTSGDLNSYGDRFAAFLEGYAPARSLACLADVARLEWAVHECERAADGVALDHAALAAVPPAALAQLRLLLHPAVRLVGSAHPILAIWEANQDGCDGTPARSEGPDRVLVRRDGLRAIPVSVDIDAWTLLQAFAARLALGEACARLADPGASLAPTLARVAGWGALGGWEVASAC